MLDVENLDAGQDFRELPDTYVIFITENDYYETGHPVYVIRNMNVTLNQPFGDGAHILYVNGEYRGDSELGRLMHDFNCMEAADMHYELLAEKTHYLKESREGVKKMCKIMEELRSESYKEGREEGRIEQAQKIAGNLKNQGWSMEQIAEAVDFGISTVESWLTPNAV